MMTVNHVALSLFDHIIKLNSRGERIGDNMPAYLHLSCLICAVLNLVPWQIVSYLLDLPEKDEEEVERAQINNFDTLWGETGGVCLL